MKEAEKEVVGEAGGGLDWGVGVGVTAQKESTGMRWRA